MKKPAFRVTPSRDGFIRATLSPVGDPTPRVFRSVDGLMLIGLIGGFVLLARFFLAH